MNVTLGGHSETCHPAENSEWHSAPLLFPRCLEAALMGHLHLIEWPELALCPFTCLTPLPRDQEKAAMEQRIWMPSLGGGALVKKYHPEYR